MTDTDRYANFRTTYADMSDEILMRERACIIASLNEGDRRTRIAGVTNTADIEAIRDVCLAEIKTRLERGEWEEPRVPVPAAFVAISNQVSELKGDAEIIGITMIRRSSWDGIDKDVAFDCIVLSHRTTPEHADLCHDAVVRCCNGQLWADLGKGAYDLSATEGADQFERRSRLVLYD